MELTAVKGLRSALPYIRKFAGELFVVKVGGDALESSATIDNLVEQLSILHQVGIRFVMVHGGGPQASRLGERLGIQTQMVDGRRVTSPEFVEPIVMALNGSVRTAILCSCRRLGLPAIGVSGIDFGLIRSTRRGPVKTSLGDQIDYGEVGDIVEIRPEPLHAVIRQGMVPIVSCLTADDCGNVLNINADDVAAALAVALQARKLILVTKPRGIMTDVGDPRSLISQLDLDGLDQLEMNGTISEGMLPKSKAIRHVVERGVESVHVLSFDYPDAILVEIFTNEGCGTMITRRCSE